MKHLGLKFYSNDPDIGEVSSIYKADFAVDRFLMTIEEVREKYPPAETSITQFGGDI